MLRSVLVFSFLFPSNFMFADAFSVNTMLWSFTQWDATLPVLRRIREETLNWKVLLEKEQNSMVANWGKLLQVIVQVFCTIPVTISGHPCSYYRHGSDAPAITMISLKCGKSTLGNRTLGSGLNVLIQWQIRNSTGRVGYRFHQAQNCIKEMIKCLNIFIFL